MGAKGALRILKDSHDRDCFAAYCPGCKEFHVFDPRWTFDGDYDRPTFSPSMLVNANTPSEPRCHSFVISGHWHFLDDSQHSLKGQVVPMRQETD